MVLVMGAVVVAELAFAATPLPGATRAVPMVFLLAYSKISIKAASFVFYLQLAGGSSEPGFVRSAAPESPAIG